MNNVYTNKQKKFWNNAPESLDKLENKNNLLSRDTIIQAAD